MKNGSAEQLLTAPQVARHCSADLKTIHNWVNAGEIRYFRTPGRHLRFRPVDVAEFLERFGYSVPPSLQAFARRVVMVIDSDSATTDAVRGGLPPRDRVCSYDCPVQALLAVSSSQPDLIVSEVELPAVDGYHFVERLSAGAAREENRSCPVVLFTGAEGVDRGWRNAGAAAVVRKPDARSLQELVGQLLGARGPDPDELRE